MKHVILGAGGTIGNVLAHELININEDVRLVSRRNYSISGAESFTADLTSYKDTLSGVSDCDIAYLCAGLPYDSKIWEDWWPVIMQNTLNACKKNGVKLIFFDNVYMYGKVKGIMTEETPYNPRSRKGEVRAKVATALEHEIKAGNIKAIIARSADFYGPYASRNSVLHILAINNMMNRKRAYWLIDDKNLHSFTYTFDCARGMLLLANNEDCYNQTWHLPTSYPIDGQTFIYIIANCLGIDPDYSVLNKWSIKMAGLFDKTVQESYEMLYQNESNYHFDSTKFNSLFNYKPKTYYDGVKETIKFLSVSSDQAVADPGNKDIYKSFNLSSEIRHY
jgi:nucleoside-diphosphate-sugar epimerase